MDILPDLLLPSMIGRYGERHQLLERHAIRGINVKQLRRDGRKPKPLLHHIDRDEEDGRDLLLGTTLLAQRLECAELVERMKCDPMHILGERVLFRRNLAAGFVDDAGDWRGLGETLLLHQEFERAVAAAAGRHLEHAGVLSIGVEDGPDVETLQELPAGDVLGEILDRDPGLDPPHIRLGQHELVEGNVARGRQLDLLNGLCHVSFSGTGGQDPLSASNPFKVRSAALLLYEGSAETPNGKTLGDKAGDTGHWHPRLRHGQAARSRSFFAFASMSRRTSWCDFSRATAVMPCTKSKMLSGGRPSSVSTASMILPVSALENPRRRRNSVRSSSLCATIRSRAALMPLTKGMGEELAKFNSAGAASWANLFAAYLEWRMMISSKSSTPHRLRFWQTARR